MRKERVCGVVNHEAGEPTGITADWLPVSPWVHSVSFLQPFLLSLTPSPNRRGGGRCLRKRARGDCTAVPNPTASNTGPAGRVSKVS